MTAPSETLVEKEMLARRAKVLEIVETRLAFARVHRTHNNRPLRFDDRPYLREMLNEAALTGEDIQKCVKCGITEVVIAGVILPAASCGLDVMVSLPSGPVLSRYVHNRIDRPMSYVGTYGELLKAVPDPLDNVTLKAFGAGTMNFVSAETPRSFRETPVDVLVIEELDESDQENLERAYGRLTDSDYKITYRIANPTHPDFGINKHYKQGTQRKWHLKCRSCGEEQPLDWFDNVVSTLRDEKGQVREYVLRDREWRGSGRDVKVFCRKCGGALDRLESDAKHAFWRDTNPGAPRRSRHFNQLYLPNRTIAEMWRQFTAAEDDPCAMEVFYNEVLGLTYSTAGSKLTHEILNSCAAQAKYTCPDSGSCCAAGLDVGTRLDLVIYDNPAVGIRRLLFAGKLRTLSEVRGLLERYDVRRCVADLWPEKRAMEEFQQEIGETDGGWCVWLCDFNIGNALKTATLANSASDLSEYSDEPNVIRVDRTWLLDRDQASYVNRRTWLPRDAAGLIDGEHYEELCAIERVAVKRPDGESRYKWTKGKDHQRLASAYALLACEMCGFDRPRAETPMAVTAPERVGEFAI